MKRKISIALAIAVLFLSCRHESNSVAELKKTIEPLADMAMSSKPAADSAAVAFESKSFESESKSKTPFQGPTKQNPPPVPADWGKKIIRNAELNFEVADFSSANKNISEAVRASGGYIASSSEQTVEDQIKSDITIRVPREKFDELVNRLCSYSKNLLQKNIMSQDVTEEYVDTKSRINTREKVLARYYEFLHQAKKIDEVLEVQGQINDIQEEIDVATGRVNYINHQSVLSTIHLNVSQKITPTIQKPDEPGFISKLLYNFKDGWEFCQMLFLGLVKIWPFYILAIAIWLLVKRNRKLTPVPIPKSDADL